MTSEKQNRDLPDSLRIFGISFMVWAVMWAIKYHGAIDLLLCLIGLLAGVFMVAKSKSIDLQMDLIDGQAQQAEHSK